jgi:hypothetical protein
LSERVHNVSLELCGVDDSIDFSESKVLEGFLSLRTTERESESLACIDYCLSFLYFKSIKSQNQEFAKSRHIPSLSLLNTKHPRKLGKETFRGAGPSSSL